MRSQKSKHTRLPQLEVAIREADADRNLAVGAALICIKEEQLFALEGFVTFWDYIEQKAGLFGIYISI